KGVGMMREAAGGLGFRVRVTQCPLHIDAPCHPPIGRTRNPKLPTAYRLPPTAYRLLPTAYCLLPTAEAETRNPSLPFHCSPFTIHQLANRSKGNPQHDAIKLCPGSHIPDCL